MIIPFLLPSSAWTRHLSGLDDNSPVSNGPSFNFSICGPKESVEEKRQWLYSTHILERENSQSCFDLFSHSGVFYIFCFFNIRKGKKKKEKKSVLFRQAKSKQIIGILLEERFQHKQR